MLLAIVIMWVAQEHSTICEVKLTLVRVSLGAALSLLSAWVSHTECCEEREVALVNYLRVCMLFEFAIKARTRHSLQGD